MDGAGASQCGPHAEGVPGQLFPLPSRPSRGGMLPTPEPSEARRAMGGGLLPLISSPPSACAQRVSFPKMVQGPASSNALIFQEKILSSICLVFKNQLNVLNAGESEWDGRCRLLRFILGTLLVTPDFWEGCLGPTLPFSGESRWYLLVYYMNLFLIILCTSLYHCSWYQITSEILPLLTEV